MPVTCPECNSPKVFEGRVKDTAKGYNLVARFYQCDDCNHVWMKDCGHCLKKKNGRGSEVKS